VRAVGSRIVERVSGRRRPPFGPPSIVVLASASLFTVGAVQGALGPPVPRTPTTSPPPAPTVVESAAVDAPPAPASPTTTPTIPPSTTSTTIGPATTSTPVPTPVPTTVPTTTSTTAPTTRPTRPNTATTATTTSTTVRDESITIAATGEILPHPSIVEHARRFGGSAPQRYDFGPIFAELRPSLEAADVAICHLEVPVAPDESQLSGYPVFGIPADVGAGIAASGWDRCSTASNHSNDKGTAGIVATIEALDAAGVGFVGTARSPEEADAAPFSTVGGTVVAHFSYTWGFNGAPPEAPWMTDVIDVDQIRADAAHARTTGADVVVVSLHWGVEYDRTGSDQQRRLATELLSSPDVDLLIGHGPHVIQPVLDVGGEYALLSVGNLVANQGGERPHTYDGMIATVTFTRRPDGRFVAAPPVIAPTWYDRGAGVVRAVDAALRDPALSSLHGELLASRDRTAAIVGDYISPR
jgi:poly-gamma-glutamate synthesis protein (capsule biosynthesis protein)